ncbi:GTP-binding protein [Methanolobus sp. WCC5]|uniref:GTP-binding protein n=1 Tax=Methanolobus sp. WCC5 TaxID=3125785 RepID=UPI00324A42ED
MHVVIIGGFLGSGKTTTMVNMSKYLAMKGYIVALILNEVGEADAGVCHLKGYSVCTKEITNGCICCTLNVSMKTALTGIRDTYNPDFVIVEPSGLAFPWMVRENLELMDLGDSMTIAPIVTLIDGVRFKDLMRGLRVYATRQIEDSEILAINKADVVDPVQLSLFKDSIGQLNPEATILTMSSGEKDEGFFELMDVLFPADLLEKTASSRVNGTAPSVRTSSTVISNSFGVSPEDQAY